MSKHKPGQGSETKALARPRTGTLRVQRAWENFEESVGGRERLLEALQYSTDENGQRLLAHLEDPRADKLGLRKLCADSRVSFPQLYAIFKDAAKAKAHAEALIVQSDYLPSIMADTCKDALSRSGPCPFCEGSGQRRNDRGEAVHCYTCDGTGKLRKPGNAESRKLVFESAGLTGKRGPLVAVQQNNWQGAGFHSFEDIIAMKDKALEEANPRRDSVPIAAEFETVPEESRKSSEAGRSHVEDRK